MPSPFNVRNHLLKPNTTRAATQLNWVAPNDVRSSKANSRRFALALKTLLTHKANGLPSQFTVLAAKIAANGTTSPRMRLVPVHGRQRPDYVASTRISMTPGSIDTSERTETAYPGYLPSIDHAASVSEDYFIAVGGRDARFGVIDEGPQETLDAIASATAMGPDGCLLNAPWLQAGLTLAVSQLQLARDERMDCWFRTPEEVLRLGNRQGEQEENLFTASSSESDAPPVNHGMVTLKDGTMVDIYSNRPKEDDAGWAAGFAERRPDGLPVVSPEEADALQAGIEAQRAAIKLTPPTDACEEADAPQPSWLRACSFDALTDEELQELKAAYTADTDVDTEGLMGIAGLSAYRRKHQLLRALQAIRNRPADFVAVDSWVTGDDEEEGRGGTYGMVAALRAEVAELKAAVVGATKADGLRELVLSLKDDLKAYRVAGGLPAAQVQLIKDLHFVIGDDLKVGLAALRGLVRDVTKAESDRVIAALRESGGWGPRLGATAQQADAVLKLTPCTRAEALDIAELLLKGETVGKDDLQRLVDAIEQADAPSDEPTALQAAVDYLTMEIRRQDNTGAGVAEELKALKTQLEALSPTAELTAELSTQIEKLKKLNAGNGVAEGLSAEEQVLIKKLTGAVGALVERQDKADAFFRVSSDPKLWALVSSVIGARNRE